MALPDFALFLIEQARALHDPGAPATEYTRGQAELIVDAAGLSMDEHRDEVVRLITRARGLTEGDRSRNVRAYDGPLTSHGSDGTYADNH